MLCAISGEAPEEPVASKKSGAVFEKRLIEKYIEENGKDPVSGEELDLEDLLPIKSARIVRPRPPTLTSIPALLSQFQNEWDSLAIETYNLREQLARTREELATALYQHDAAVRVIARLTKERDEARDALSKVTVSGSAATNGDAMAVDTDTLPEYLAELVDETQAKSVSLCRLHLSRPSVIFLADWCTLQAFQEPEEAPCARGVDEPRRHLFCPTDTKDRLIRSWKLISGCWSWIHGHRRQRRGCCRLLE